MRKEYVRPDGYALGSANAAKIPDETYREAYGRLGSCLKVARELGVSESTARYRLRFLGVELRPPGRPPRTPEEEKRAFTTCWDCGKKLQRDYAQERQRCKESGNVANARCRCEICRRADAARRRKK